MLVVLALVLFEINDPVELRSFACDSDVDTSVNPFNPFIPFTYGSALLM